MSNLKYYRNKTNTSVGLYDINFTIPAGQVVKLTEAQVDKSAHLQHFLSKGVLEEASVDSQPISFQNSSMPNVVLPKGVQPEQRIKIGAGVDEVVVNNEMGSVVVGGKLPGQGEVKPMEQVIKEGADKMQETISSTPPPVAPPVVTTTAPVPDDLKDWFFLRHAEKKSKILECKDIDWLMYVSKYDTNAKVQKLIDQRLKELKG